MNSLKKLFSPSYLFQIESVVLSRSDKAFMLAGCFALLLAIVFKIAEATAKNPIDKLYRHKFFNLFLTLALWELIWFGCRYESVNFFGSHFVAILGFAIALVWLVVLGIDVLKEYKPKLQTWEKEQVRLKYLPK